MSRLVSIFMIVALVFATTSVAAQTADTAWIKDFRAFRDAVYQGNKAKAKTFIDFPMESEANDIWGLIHWGKEGNFNETEFTAEDFDKYFNKIFSKRLINGMLKIKSAELGKKGISQSPTFKESDTLTYTVTAAPDHEKNRFVLQLSINNYIKDEKGVVGGEAAETSIMYIFDIVDKRKLKLVSIAIAG